MWEALPDGCVDAVCSAGGGRIAALCASTCRGWKQAALRDNLWKQLCAADLNLHNTSPSFHGWRSTYARRFTTSSNWHKAKCTVHVLQGHTARVSAVAMDHELLVTASWDGTLRIWDRNNWTCRKVLTGHESQVISVAISPRYVYSGGADRTVRVYDRQTWECVQVLHGHADWVKALAASGDYVASGGIDGTVRVWQSSTGQLARVLMPMQQSAGMNMFADSDVTALAMDPDIVVAGCRTGDVLVFEVGSWKLRHLSRPAEPYPVLSIAVDENHIVIAHDSPDTQLRVLPRSGGIQPFSLQAIDLGRIKSVALTKDWLVSLSEDDIDSVRHAMVRLWDRSDWQCKHRMKGNATVGLLGALAADFSAIVRAFGERGVCVMDFYDPM
eukprot:jgi/Chlat1/4274/Chrsp29S04371